MEVDLSDYVISEVLSIECEDRRWRLVAYLSKSSNETERNNEIHNKEILVVIGGLENQRHLLEGAKYKFEVWIDYRNLEYFLKAQKLNHDSASKINIILDFTLKHVLGTKIEKVNRLSRKLDWKIGVENKIKNQKLIK